MRERLGGVGLSDLNQDDADGECGDGKFPLLNALADAVCM